MPRSVKIGEFRAATAYWQGRLGLQEWKIKVVFGKPSADPDLEREMHEGTLGNCCWDTETAEATILLHREAQIDTLVHEMLHLRLEGHRSPVEYDQMYERALNAITTGLLGK